MCREAESLETPVKEAIKAGEALKTRCSQDDVEVVQGKIDKLKDKYRSLVRTSAGTLGKFEDASKLSNEFFTTTGELLGWCEYMERKLEEAAHQEGEEGEDVHKVLKVKALMPKLYVMTSSLSVVLIDTNKILSVIDTNKVFSLCRC